MSSLLQFNGETSKRGVGLQFYHTHGIETDLPPIHGNPSEPVMCAICGKTHPRIHVAWRKPVGMFGPWVVFRYHGKENVPDLSCPIAVHVLPKGARAMTDDESNETWHK